MTPLEWMLFVAAPYLIFGFALGVNLLGDKKPRC
uniref:Uncharacterized protein n=1 Tax=Gloeothece verrucosa (strain PCC 7822) TaxID=497965 RepID=E0U7T7_GLOV7|nr:hypothetical protein Cyan7822_2942 [Gloeothece verrucosa PCC 7822]